MKNKKTLTRTKTKPSKKPNIKIILYSIIAFGFVTLAILIDWIFIIGALIMIYLNQKELMKK